MNTIELSPTTPAASSAPGRRPFVRTGARIAITITAVAAAAIWLPRTLPSVDTLRSTFESAAWHWVLAAALLQFGSIGMLVRQQRRLLRALGTPIPLRRMAAITYSSTALAMSLPAGSAISAGYTFRQFRANGASTRTAGLALVLSGALSVGSLVLLFGAGWAVAFASGPDGPIAAHPVTTMVLALAVASLAIAGVRLVQRRRRTRTGSGPLTDRTSPARRRTPARAVGSPPRARRRARPRLPSRPPPPGPRSPGPPPPAPPHPGPRRPGPRRPG